MLPYLKVAGFSRSSRLCLIVDACLIPLKPMNTGLHMITIADVIAFPKAGRFQTGSGIVGFWKPLDINCSVKGICVQNTIRG